MEPREVFHYVGFFIASWGVYSKRAREMSLRITVADDEPLMGEFYQDVLPLMGHKLLAVAQSGAELLACCRKERPDLVITDIKMPELDGIEAARAIWREMSVPVILVSAYTDAEFISRAQDIPVMAFLVKPISAAKLRPAIQIGVRRFAELQALRQEAGAVRQVLQERKLIERAKGLTMKNAGVDEAAALRRLQDVARTTRRNLVQIAEMIVTADAVFTMRAP
jgi:two-component system, response regulator PdtaR